MKKLLALLMMAILVLGACSQGADKKEEESNGNNEGQSSEKIEIEHALGTASFEKAPKRVVILEWNYAEDLLALGVQPVGLTDIEGFNKWVKIDAKLSKDVVDVGTRQEPNLEEISKLNPDAIIGLLTTHEAIYEDLQKIAPTIIYDASSEKVTADLYGNMMDTFKKNAKLLDKEQEGEEAIQKLDDTFASAKKEIEGLTLPSKQFVFTQAYSANQAPLFRLFTKNSTVSTILEKVGLENKIQDNEKADWGFIESNIEGLANYDDAIFIHAIQEDDPILENVASNKVWNNLQFVKEEHMYDIGGDTWTFGGVLSAETLVNNLLNALHEE